MISGVLVTCVLVCLVAVTEQAAPVHIPMETFQFEEYFFTFYTQRANWLEAFTICRATHARLAVIHTKARADFLARTLTETQMSFEDIWIGGMFMKGQWLWASTSHKIDTKKDEAGYPPWVRVPTQRGKNCLAFDRKGYEAPLFVELHCLQQKPFVCEKSVMSAIDNYPQMGMVMKYRNTKYIAYHARVTWEEALAFCRQTGSILATIPDMQVAYFIVGMMRRSRPELEALWIGGEYLFNEWVWLSNNTAIPNVTGPNGFPPWKDDSSKHIRDKDCLMMDHHACRHDQLANNYLGVHARRDRCEEPVFLEASCSRRKPFICEKPPESEPDQEYNATYMGVLYTFVNKPESWEAAQNDCIARNMTLAKVESEQKLTFVVTMMSEEMEDWNHMWLGGKYSMERDMWAWTADNETIPGGSKLTPYNTSANEIAADESSSFLNGENVENDGLDADGFRTAAPDDEPEPEPEEGTFPPWCVKDSEYENEGDCLNLDRGDHSSAIWYGMNCSTPQGYVCETDANMTTVKAAANETSATLYLMVTENLNFNLAWKGCIKHNMSLAIVNNITEAIRVASIIPENVTAWVGGVRENGHWRWKKTGEIIPDLAKSDGYPPWEILSTKPGTQCLAMKLVGPKKWPVFEEQPCENTINSLCQTTHVIPLKSRGEQ